MVGVLCVVVSSPEASGSHRLCRQTTAPSVGRSGGLRDEPLSPDQRKPLLDGTVGPADAPGQNPFGPPGQIKQDPNLADGVPNPFFGVPPGHWDDPARVALPTSWIPPNMTTAFPIVWNPVESAWGVWVSPGQFVVFTP